MPKNSLPLFFVLLFVVLLVLAVKYLNFPASAAIGGVTGLVAVLVVNGWTRRKARPRTTRG